MDNLPGLPDNLSRSKCGNSYWVATVFTRAMPSIEKLLTEWPFLRSLIVKVSYFFSVIIMYMYSPIQLYNVLVYDREIIFIANPSYNA